jgi:hypothetical protein
VRQGRGKWIDRRRRLTTIRLTVPECRWRSSSCLSRCELGYFPIEDAVPGVPQLGVSTLRDLASTVPDDRPDFVNLPADQARPIEPDVLAAVHRVRTREAPPRRLFSRRAPRRVQSADLAGRTVDAGLLSTSLVVEAVASWPGPGPLLLEAIAARDIHLVIGASCARRCCCCGSCRRSLHWRTCAFERLT